MKKSLKRLVSIIMAACLCVAMVPGAAMAASVPAADELDMSIALNEGSGSTYDVTYTTTLTISEKYAKIVAVNKGDSAFLQNLRFTCILKSALLKNVNDPEQSDFTFTGEGAANFAFVSCSKEGNDEIHIVYQLQESLIDSWATMSTADVKESLQKGMVMSSTKNATAAQVNAAAEGNEIKATGKVLISAVQGNLPYFDEEFIVAAEGTASARKPSSGNNGGAGSSGDSGEVEESGTSEWLNTDEDVVFMVGDENGDFRPDMGVTRAEVAQMFYALLKDKNIKITAEFDDVADEAWYSKAILTLASLGKVVGVGENKYAPDRVITRAEFVTIASGFVNTDGKTFASSFDDVPESHWAYRPISIAVEKGWTVGIGENKFAPDRPITRAEAAVMMIRVLERAIDKEATDSGDYRLFGDVTKEHWAWYAIVEATTKQG